MKNKIILISFITLFFVLILNSQCFAVDVSVLPEGMYDAMTSEDKEAISNCSYYCILTSSDGGYLITSDKLQIAVRKESDSSNYIFGLSGASTYNGRYKSFYYNSDTNLYDFSSESLVTSTLKSFNLSVRKLTVDLSVYSITDSNQTITDIDTGEVIYMFSSDEPSIDDFPSDDNVIEDENIIVDINTIHTDLGVICRST